MHPKCTHRSLRGTRLDNAKKSVGRPVKLAVLITQFNATEQLMNSTDYIGRATCVHLQYSTVLNCFITVKKLTDMLLLSFMICMFIHTFNNVHLFVFFCVLSNAICTLHIMYNVYTADYMCLTLTHNTEIIYHLLTQSVHNKSM